MESKDYLKLPPRTTQKIVVQLPPDARKKYNAMENDMITRIGNETIVAASAAVASSKCRQVANGGLYLNEPSADLKINNDWVPVHSVKIDALKELVEGLSGQPLLVFYQFKFDKEMLREAFPGVPDIGEFTGDKLLTMERLFNSGSIPMMIGHPQSAAHGLNLQQSCSHVCWYGLTWDLEHYEQATKRIDRQGQAAERVIVYQIVAEDTIDELMVGILAGKDRSQNALLQALKGLRPR
jgi:SNF2 family DNA or RNA helicase